MKKILLFLFFLLLFSSFSYAQISNLKVPSSIRLNENLTIAGDYTTADVLCKFVVLDSNNFAIERLSDEYSFADGSFYAERTITEPPYYRGDDFNVIVTCGTSQEDTTFLVAQPVSLAQPITKAWEYFFQESNLDAFMILGTFIAFIIVLILLWTFIIRLGKKYAG